MKKILFLLLAGGFAVACNNDAELARAEAEKAKVELELEKAKAETEIAKLKAESMARDDSKADELAKKLAEAEAMNAAQRAAPEKEIKPAKTETRGASGDELAKFAEQLDSALEPIEVVPKVKLQVAERKSDGNPWDAMGGAPDVLVVLSAPSGTVQSSVGQDQFNPQFTFGKLKLNAGDSVRITVVDKDSMQNDPIGSSSVVFKGPGKSSEFTGGSMSGSIQF